MNMQAPTDLLQFGHPISLFMLVAVPLVVFFLWRKVQSESIERSHSAVVLALFAALCCGTIVTIARPSQVIVAHVDALKGNKVVGLLDDSGSESTCFDGRAGYHQLSDGKSVSSNTSFDTHCADAFHAFRDLFIEFIGQHPVDKIGVTLIDDAAMVLTKADQGNVITVQKVRELKEAANGTDLKVGLAAVLDQFSADDPEQGRYLLIMSDGQDDIKSADSDALVARIKNLHVQVYFIKNAMTGVEQEEPLEVLVRRAGGIAVTAHDREDMRAAFDAIGARIQPAPYQKPTVVVADLTVYFGVGTIVLFILFAFAAKNIWFRKKRWVE